MNKEKRIVKNNLSVYYYPYYWHKWRGFLGNIRQWFTNHFRSAKERAKQGFCIEDTWDCGNTIIDYLVNILCDFRNRADGYPLDFNCYEDWIRCIDKIIDRLDYSRQNPDEFNEFTKLYYDVIDIDPADRTEEDKDISNKYWEKTKEIRRKQEHERQKAFMDLALYIDHLWW